MRRLRCEVEKRRNGIAPYGSDKLTRVRFAYPGYAGCPTQPVKGRVRLKLDAEPAWIVVP